MTTGKVYLVGAGPGDIGLITVKGMRILRAADVVVYDFHLNPQVLNYIKRNAEFIYAGKRGGHHAMTQEQINKVLVQKAREGKMVCRLKGGDPFVFGRGGEEAETLAREGIPFQVVPGVSSVIAAPAYAGIPLTHRSYSSSFMVITGSEAAAKEDSTLDWPTIARAPETLVFLMGVKNLELIVQQLVRHGKNGTTPAALIRWGTRADQKTVVGTVGTIVELARTEQVRPPAVMVVGNVIRLRDILQWYETMPLFGQRVLIAEEYTSDYEPLEELGAEVFEFPTIRFDALEDYRQLDESIAAIHRYGWLLFTGVKEFTFFMGRFLERGRDIRDLKGIRICAVDRGVVSEIEQRGIRVELILEPFNPETLVQDLLMKLKPTEGTVGSAIRVLAPRAEDVPVPFTGSISSGEIAIDAPAVYRRIKRERHGKRLLTFLAEGRISIASFTSAAAFMNFMDIVGDEARALLTKTAIAAMNADTARAVKNARLQVAILPAEETVRALVEAIIARVAHHSDIQRRLRP